MERDWEKKLITKIEKAGGVEARMGKLRGDKDQTACFAPSKGEVKTPYWPLPQIYHSLLHLTSYSAFSDISESLSTFSKT